MKRAFLLICFSLLMAVMFAAGEKATIGEVKHPPGTTVSASIDITGSLTVFDCNHPEAVAGYSLINQDAEVQPAAGKHYQALYEICLATPPAIINNIDYRQFNYWCLGYSMVFMQDQCYNVTLIVRDKLPAEFMSTFWYGRCNGPMKVALI